MDQMEIDNEYALEAAEEELMEIQEDAYCQGFASVEDYQESKAVTLEAYRSVIYA